MSLSPEQSRAGRALLNWSQDRLASEAKVAKATIANFELGKRVAYDRTLRDLQVALEAAGVVFLAPGETTDGGAGVRLATDVTPPLRQPTSDDEIAARDDQARGLALQTADRLLSGSDASDEEKAERRDRLTRKPKGASRRNG